MIKSEELANPDSCLNRAADDEMIFVLRSHDLVFADTILDWCANRIVEGKNSVDDDQITSALRCAAKGQETRPVLSYLVDAMIHRIKIRQSGFSEKDRELISGICKGLEIDAVFLGACKMLIEYLESPAHDISLNHVDDIKSRLEKAAKESPDFAKSHSHESMCLAVIVRAYEELNKIQRGRRQ